MAKRKVKKEKPPKVDGLSAADIERIRKAIRQVWSWSHPRRLCAQRCIGRGGFSYCERCKKRAPKIFIDHRVAVGLVDGGFIERLFCPSSALQGLCKVCHDLKTKQERVALRKGFTDSF